MLFILIISLIFKDKIFAQKNVLFKDLQYKYINIY